MLWISVQSYTWNFFLNINVMVFITQMNFESTGIGTLLSKTVIQLEFFHFVFPSLFYRYEMAL